MASRTAPLRRGTSRVRGNDENVVPTQGLRNKSSVSALGSISTGVVGGKNVMASKDQAAKKAASAAAALKVGAKRTAMGGVVGNGVKEEEMSDKAAIKGKAAEARQPLASSRVNNAQNRPIAPVPTRHKPLQLDQPMSVIESEDDVSEMDVDQSKRDQEVKMDDEEYGSELSDDEEEEEDEDDWVKMSEEDAEAAKLELADVRSRFKDDIDMFDTTMVAEYADEIFAHMEDLEQRVMPSPRYMDFQTEIEWTMRTTLIDWLLQVHLRYHMLPETLWIAVNLVDRFLSVRVVSLVKLQLVGVTAMFIAAKYEEILAPSVDEFVYMTENGYTKDEILKGERIILQTLDFTVSSYCSPYSWCRRISKADDYDIQTRTLSKFLMEVTLLDHRFLRCKPSMIAAVGMYLARKMLGGTWDEAFVYYSNFTETQLIPGATLLCDRLIEPDFENVYVYKKYANKKFLRASQFARDWALNNAASAFYKE